MVITSKSSNPEILAISRAIIGYLGEKDQFAWWQSSFFIPASDAFLEPVFTRTKLLAKCNGVTSAAAIVHDERIGVGNVYHLFRLPEELEQAIHRVLYSADLIQKIVALSLSKDNALDYLQNQSQLPKQSNIGPTWMGKTSSIYDDQVWQKVTGYYLSAFEQSTEIYPYFADVA